MDSKNALKAKSAKLGTDVMQRALSKYQTAIFVPHVADGISLWHIQGEASFTQRLFLRPGCQGNEFETEFLLCTIKRPLNEEKILMDFFCDLKFLLIN